MDAIYARQSIDNADSISIESQIEFCKYETRGSPCRIYRDKGYSGKNTDRPAFQSMLLAIRAGEIKRVICYKLDRCSRSIVDFANLMEEFQKYDVEFLSCTEKFDTASPVGRAMLNICIVFAQLERETIQQRVYDAYHSRNKRGFYMGGKIPFGFKLEPFALEGKKTSRYTTVPNEIKILEMMYSIYEKPLTSLGDVVTALNDAGIPHPRKRDGRWNRTHIGRMLHNPVYVKADLAVYLYFKENGVIIHNNPEDFIGTNGCYLFREKENAHSSCSTEGHHLVLAPHQGIIPSDIWLRCRKKHIQKSETGRQYKIKNTWLAGKIKCAKCGYALVIRKAVKPNGKMYRYVICSEANQGARRCEGIHGIKAEIVEDLVWTQLQEKLKLFPRFNSHMDLSLNPAIQNYRSKLAQIDLEIEKITDKSLEASGALFHYLSNRVTQLDLQRQKYNHKLLELESELSVQDHTAQPVMNYPHLWNQLTMEDKILAVDCLIEKITLCEEEMTIHWKF